MTGNPLPGDASRWGRFDALQDRNRLLLNNVLEAASADRANRTATDQKIGDFYAACMDEKNIEARGLEAIQRDLNRIAVIQDRKEITDIVIYLFRLGSYPFFRFGSEQDAKDSTHVIAGMDQGGLGLPDRDYYLKTDEKSVDLRNKYLTHLQTIFALLNSPPAEAQKKAAAVMAIETELAKGSLDRVSRRDPEKIYHKMTVAELSALAPQFDWVKLFQDLGAPPIQSLNVAVPDFFHALDAVLRQQPMEDLKTYLTWNLIRANILFLPASFQQASFEFYDKTLRGAKEMRARWKRCVDITDQQLPDALGKTFVDKTLGDAGKKRTQQMVAAIEKALEKDIRSLDWMTPKTKEQAIVKLHGITNKIGNKNKWLDYAGVQIVRNDPYTNSARASTFELARDLAKIGKPVDKTEWGMSQPTVNAYYDPQHNDVNFPAGILQPPFYDNKMDDAVNYGAIGAVIGHELTHGFDDEGRQFDAKGNLRDWWTAKDGKAFEQRTDCLVNQYSGYSPVNDAAGQPIFLKGKLTLGENTADNGGVRMALAAYKKSLAGKTPAVIDGFTPEQRFFLGYAVSRCENVTDEYSRILVDTDPHSPGKFRLIGAVTNMPEFWDAFSCKAGQPMVRGENACRVW